MMHLLRLSVLFLILLVGTILPAQVLDPSDPVVDYDSNNPPARPAWGQVGKWVRTPIFNWNTNLYKAYIYKTINFRLLFPKGYTPGAGQKYPLVLVFHGAGRTGGLTDNENQLAIGGQEQLAAWENGTYEGFALYPQSYGGFSDTEKQEIIELLEYMVENAQVDPFQISIHGRSNGARTAWSFISEYPTIAASAQIMSGVTADRSMIDDIKYTPTWYAQGGLDKNPTQSGAEQLINALERAGSNIRYTLYPEAGHGVWSKHYYEPEFFPFMARANKINPWPLFGKSEVCPGEPINITLGLTPGFEAYQWRKDGVVISGATSHELIVTDLGTYGARVKRNGEWSYWSPTPVKVEIKAPTQTPPIQLASLHSSAIPSPDGRDFTVLKLPEGFESYQWKRAGTDEVIGTEATLQVSTPGEYVATVTEEFGCSTSAAAPFKIVSANGVNSPDPATGVSANALSKTQLKVIWSDNPTATYDETGFEIYRSTKAGGPYQLVRTTAANVLSYVDAGLISGQTYYYIIRAVNQSSASAVSNEASATTERDTTPPTKPRSLRVVSNTTRSAKLRWRVSTDDTGVRNYIVYRDGTPSLATQNTNITVHNLTPNQVYKFTVRAVDKADNLSAASNEVTVSTFNDGTIPDNPPTAPGLSDFSVYVNFSLSGDPAPAPWNNTGNEPLVGNIYGGLKRESQINTGSEMMIADNGDNTTFAKAGFKGVVTGDDSGIYPDAVLKSYWWIEQAETATLILRNLDLAMKYDLVFFASRAASNRGTNFTVNGTTVTLNASYNTTETVEINHIDPDENGHIIIDMRSMPGAILGYLGAMVIHASPVDSQNARTLAAVPEKSVPNELVTTLSLASTYPNPFSDKVFVSFDSNDSTTYQVTLFDLMGSAVYSK